MTLLILAAILSGVGGLFSAWLSVESTKRKTKTDFEDLVGDLQLRLEDCEDKLEPKK